MCEEENILDTFGLPKSNSFIIKNVYGFDKQIGISYYRNNLREPCIIYIVSKMIIIYNLTTTLYQYFSGHEEKILLCKIDRNEKIMITADKESVFIWDLKSNEKSDLTLLRILHEPFKDETIDISTAAVSCCGKYLILISKLSLDSENDVKNCFLQYWEWSFGHEECNELIVLPHKYGPIKTITFSSNKNEENYFALTFNNIVLFATIQKNEVINIHIPFNAHSRICNELHQTVYLENSPLTVSVTNKGRLIIWCDLENQSSNNKNYYRMLQLRNCAINDVKNFDNYIVTADELGEVRFYNYDYLLMYIYTNDIVKSINILSLCPVSEAKIIEDDDKEFAQKNYVKDFTREQNIFIVRKILIVTETGYILLCDVSKNTHKYVLQTCSDINVAGDVFKTRFCTVTCLANGFVNVFNYKKNILTAENSINQYYKSKIKPFITACKISPDEFTIFVGMRNGDLWILDAITCKPIKLKPLQVSNKNIDLIVFHPTDNQFSAISTSDFTLTLLQYKDDKWQIVCKYRYHCKPIINIFFLYVNNINYVVTIGEDRMYIRYDMSLEANPLVPVLDIRLDQFPTICCAELFDSGILAVDTSENGKVILTANNSYKFVFYDAFTAKKLFTFLGPVFDSPIKKILYIPPSEENPDSLLILASRKTLGAAVLPLDGNPYRYCGFKVHINQIERVYRTNDDSVILHGNKNIGSYWWTINKKFIMEKFLNNCNGLEPFCSLLPGGKSGWFFKEIRDYFVYFQLLGQDIQDKKKKFMVGDFMDVSEIPDFMRAIGYFPSEYEIKNFLSEVNDVNLIVVENILLDEDKISFLDLVKLYINHKPVFGYPLDDIINSIKYMKMIKESNKQEDNKECLLTMDDILQILTEKFEKISELQAMKYIKELLKPNKYSNICQDLTPEQIEKEFNQLQNKFTIFQFCNYLLGLDVLQSPICGSSTMKEFDENELLLKNDVKDLDQSDLSFESDSEL